MNRQKFSEFEVTVMNALLSGDDPKLDILRQQFKVAALKERKLTGVGFFVDFLVPNNSLKLDVNQSMHLNDVIAQVDGVKEGVGFNLLIKDGVIEMLEGFTYDEPWPNKIENYEIFYLSGSNLKLELKRDMNLLKEKFLSK